ncbi:hypothetical protein [Dokdonella soli]
MQEISFDTGVATALDSVINTRLTLLAGAGLSMAPPSLLPNAAALAATAKRRYDALHGATRQPLAVSVEDQAEFFFQRGELASVYFRTLIDSHAFAGPSNSGHFAIADLLLVRGIQTAITTNVDVMIENAGHQLHGQVGAGIDQQSVALLSPDAAPLLKIHGCRTIDPTNMVWAPGQLNAPPVDARIASSAQWLLGRLLDRDLVIVGYWTDWDYLNAVLTSVLGAVSPSRVIVVDPADGATFATKAPALYALGQKVPNAFQHVRASGADFLAALRRAFSMSFVRRVLHGGADDYEEATGAPPSIALTEPPDLDNETLWRIRRDLEGCAPTEPCTSRNPPNESLPGLTILQLRARGATADGPFWLLNGQRIRVLRTPNKPLHRVVAAYQRETAPAIAPELVIAVGAEAQALPTNIAREGSPPTITRGTSGRWITRPEAVQELGL